VITWLRASGSILLELENTGNFLVGAYYQLPSHGVSTDELFHRQLGEIYGLVVLALMGDFNFPDINWEYHTAMMSKSWKFLKFVGDNFVSQVFSEPTRKDALLDLGGGRVRGRCDGKWLSWPQ